MVSIIIPAYNEIRSIRRTLERLRELEGNFEIIVVDGSSGDGTADVAEALAPNFPRALRVIRAVRNRGGQLNHGVASAQGNILLFLHADALLPPSAIQATEQALSDASVVGGNFQLVFEGQSRWSRFFTWANRVRRPFGIYYGDSGLFVRREVFARLGGFKPLPVMDDYEFVRRLERAGRTACLSPAIVVSDRRWRMQGVLRTCLGWVWVQTLYSLGVPARHLARWYKAVR